jgi:cell division protein FtsB
MTPHETERKQQGPWPWTILLAVLLQIIAFSFWAGSLTARVDALTTAVEQLQKEFTAMVGK